MKKVLVSSVSIFIIVKTLEFLLQDGIGLVSIDNIKNYYDLNPENFELQNLLTHHKFKSQKINVEDKSPLKKFFSEHRFNGILNFADKAGVCYYKENPNIYVSTNAQGGLNLLEFIHAKGVKKFVLASTSSLFAGLPMPFKKELPVNTPIASYTAIKKAPRAMDYSYNYLYNIEVSFIRHFPLYCREGRPDASAFIFGQNSKG